MLSREEVTSVLSHLEGTMWIIGLLLYGAGLRLEECLELRVKDIDFDRSQITVKRGKGQKDRTTMLPGAVVDPLRKHLANVRRLHETDVAVRARRIGLSSFRLDVSRASAALSDVDVRRVRLA